MPAGRAAKSIAELAQIVEARGQLPVNDGSAPRRNRHWTMSSLALRRTCGSVSACEAGMCGEREPCAGVSWSWPAVVIFGEGKCAAFIQRLKLHTNKYLPPCGAGISEYSLARKRSWSGLLPQSGYRVISQAAAVIRPTALSGRLRSPNGANFSNSTNAVNATIAHTFITPPTKSSSISVQQQPRQYTPWSMPRRNAPDGPGLMCVVMNVIGDRHESRHVRFRGVNW